MSRRRLMLIVLSAAPLLACGGRSDSANRGGGNPYGLRGRVLSEAKGKPDFVLTDTRGDPFDFRRETDGYLTLLFFGYTHCPDVCPVHMANIAAVLREIDPSVVARVKVVFVTTDPARDTPERLRQWLDSFDPTFIGLTGDTESIGAAERALDLPAAELGPPDSTGSYFVGHSAVVVAFTPDDQAHVVYPFGTRQADWANDLPKLLTITWPGS